LKYHSPRFSQSTDPEWFCRGEALGGRSTRIRIFGIILRLGWIFLLAGMPVVARGESPLVKDLAWAFTHYHEDPARLDALRSGLAEAARTDPDVPNLVALAQVCFLWGDIRATTTERKLQAFDQGRQAGEQAIEKAPQDALAHLWYAINLGRWAQTHGVLRSLVHLPRLREEIATILRLDPTLPGVYALAGNVYAEVPAFFGGSLPTAERMFRDGLRLDPQFTALRVGLAKTLVQEGHPADAVQELARVLAERHPNNPAEWTVKDVPEARRLLGQLHPAP